VSGPVPEGGSLNVRSYGGFFLVVVIPIVHAVGGFFILDFLLSGNYTWGRTLRTFVLFMSNLVLAYEFVYRDLGAPYRLVGPAPAEERVDLFGLSLLRRDGGAGAAHCGDSPAQITK